MAEEEPLSEEAQDVLEKLDGVERKVAELREERDKLYRANDMLVELINQLEEQLKAERTDADATPGDTADQEDQDVEQPPSQPDSIDVEDYTYSFGEGWEPQEGVDTRERTPDLGDDIHPVRLVDEPGVGEDDIAEQIHEVRNALTTLRDPDR